MGLTKAEVAKQRAEVHELKVLREEYSRLLFCTVYPFPKRKIFKALGKLKEELQFYEGACLDLLGRTIYLSSQPFVARRRAQILGRALVHLAMVDDGAASLVRHLARGLLRERERAAFPDIWKTDAFPEGTPRRAQVLGLALTRLAARDDGARMLVNQIVLHLTHELEREAFNLPPSG